MAAPIPSDTRETAVSDDSDSDSDSFQDALDRLKLESDKQTEKKRDRTADPTSDKPVEETQSQERQSDNESSNSEDFADANPQEETEVEYDPESDPHFVNEKALEERDKELGEEDKVSLRDAAKKHKQEGNELFKASDTEAAVDAYTCGLRTCPLTYKQDRAVLYSNRAACRVRLDEVKAATADCTAALDLDPDYVRCLLRRADLYERQEKLEDALKDYNHVLELDPGVPAARAAAARLPAEIEARNEKLKAEMMGKLKELGNMVLRPFGMSTDNFKMVQDPNTGGYSISFQQNPGS